MNKQIRFSEEFKIAAVKQIIERVRMKSPTVTHVSGPGNEIITGYMTGYELAKKRITANLTL